MAEKIFNQVKLGLFVILALFFLILTLYLIGKNKNIFGRQFTLKARFENVSGLVEGNNVRYSGIEVGTVKKITIINDTAIEVSMSVNNGMLGIIRKNAKAYIGSEGLMGNKAVNIVPGKGEAVFAAENDLLPTRKGVDTDDMLRVLGRTNQNIAEVSDALKITVDRINKSENFWKLLNDPEISKDLKSSLANIRIASREAGEVVSGLHSLIADVQNGQGSVGILLRDSSFAINLEEAVVRIRQVADHADSLATSMDDFVKMLHQNTDEGKGTVHALLKDSVLLQKISASLNNIEAGTDGFNQNMEALKHSFLFRGYFRRLEKQQKK